MERINSLNYQKTAVKNSSEILSDLKTSETGLSSSEAQNRLLVCGKNKIERKKKSLLNLFVSQFKSSFVYMLLAAVFISLFLGEMVNASMILFFILLNAFLGFWQEYKSFRSLSALEKFLKNKTHVLRDGKEIIVDTEEVVPGDILVLSAGDKIAADIRFIKTENITVDESILTGETKPAVKTSGKVENKVDDFIKAKNIGFSGTLIASGKGLGLVVSTGKNSQLGEISKLALETKSQSLFHQEVGKFSTFIIKLTLVTLVFTFILNLIIKGGNFNIGEFLVFAIALAVGVVPEALPLVTTVSLSSGALYLAKKNVVVKRLSAIEELGSVNVLATDKTGTITENQLTVSEIHSDDKKETLYLASLCSSFLAEEEDKPTNSFDVAIWSKLSSEEQKKIKETVRVKDIPFNPETRTTSVLIKTKNGKEVLIQRGAPEMMFPHQKHFLDLARKQGLLGRRVLAISENGKYKGLISFVDPLKKTAKQAIKEAENLGVQVKILTGDSQEVAGSIACEVGLIEKPDDVILGSDFRKMKEEEKRETIVKRHVFARLTPQDKYDIINLLKEEDFHVGFLGEGFNDAPALEKANVALAVPGASDIAKDASDIILLNRSLHVIIDGIKEGRKTFSNTLKYIKYTLTSNFGNFYALAISTLLINYLPILPVQVLLINLFSDFPLISVATDNVEKDELLQPRSYSIREVAFFATILGLVSTIFDFAFFASFVRYGERTLQTMWFIGSILTELIIFYSIRTRRWFFKAGKPSAIIMILTAIVTLVTLIIPFTSIGQELFLFVRPKASYLLIAFVLTIAYFSTSEISKIIYYKSFGKKR